MKIIKDVLYGFVEVSDLAISIIDTPEFQRLRRIKQTSTTYLVFPSVSHNRFEHSIGVYHLTGEYLKKLDKNIFDRFLEIIKIAGLVHDLGHMAFSHTFDHLIIPELNNRNELGEHEDRSISLLKHMIGKYNLDISEEEFDIIAHCIHGKHLVPYPKFWFQIVCNSINGLDTDKLDYLQRDSYYFNGGKPIEVTFFINSSEVIDGDICYREKLLIPIYKMFNLRYTLHKEIYQHTTGVIMEHMIKDHIIRNKEFLGLEELHKDFAWVKMTDDIIYHCKDNVILNRIDSRKLYKSSHIQTKGSIEVQKKLAFNSVEDFFKNIYFFNSKKKVKYVLDKLPETFPYRMSEVETFYMTR